MTKPETRIDYGRRIARVAEHIAENLDADLDVERLAAVAYFSPRHFHRIYRETTGETVADTVRRLRLHRAAVELTRGDAPFGHVAKRAGYRTLAASWTWWSRPRPRRAIGRNICRRDYSGRPAARSCSQ